MVAQKEFNSFRIDPNNMLSQSSNTPPIIPATIAAKQASAVLYIPADMFRRGVSACSSNDKRLSDYQPVGSACVLLNRWNGNKKRIIDETVLCRGQDTKSQG
jgi:hypothetical protein